VLHFQRQLYSARTDNFRKFKVSINVTNGAGLKGRKSSSCGNITMCVTGGRHYFDRLCSDRRYSDNLQSGRHSSTSLVCLDVEIVEIGKKLEWVEALDASKARHWSRRWGDWGKRSLGRVSQCSGVPPPSEKLQRTSNTTVLPLIFGIWFGVLPIGTAPIA